MPSSRVILIGALLAAAGSLRADNSCIAPSVTTVNACGGEASRLSSIGGIEDVELNFFGSGGADFQAFFKPGSYFADSSQSEAQPPESKSTSDDATAQFSWGGGSSDGGNCCGPVQMSGVPAFFNAPSSAPPDAPPNIDAVLNKILVPNGGAPFTAANDPDPAPTPEPAYSAFLALSVGLLILVGPQSSNRRQRQLIEKLPGRMSHSEYEERYAEALDVVRVKLVGTIVGDPEVSSAGTRFVPIDGVPCKDEAVFRLAWGTETARDIVAQRWTPVR